MLGFNTRATGEILALGASVLGDATRVAPLTRDIVVLLNASDRTVKSSATQALARAWSGHGARVVLYELPDSLRLPHDIIDPIRGRALGDTVLVLLRALAYGEQPGRIVTRLNGQ